MIKSARIALATSLLAAAVALPATAQAAAPAWSVAVTESSPASTAAVQQGDGLQGGYDVGSVASWANLDTVSTTITNSGSAASSGTATATLTFSSGVSLADILNSWIAGTGSTTSGSNQVTGVTVSNAGYSYAVGNVVTGTGIPSSPPTTITAVSGASPNLTLTLSANATATSSNPVTLTLLPGAGADSSGSPMISNVSGGPYEVGNTITGTGIASGATIIAVNGSSAPTPVSSSTANITLTLSANSTSSNTSIALTEAATRVTPTGTGWTCTNAAAPVCTNTNALLAGSSYSPITAFVQVTATAGAATQGGSVGAHIDFNPAVSGGGASSASPVIPLAIDGIPNLTSVDMANGPFRQGDIGDSYTVNVTNNGLGPSNSANPNPDTGTANNPIVVTETTVPSGETPTAMYGPGWTCSVPATTAGVAGAVYTLPADSCWRTDSWPWGSILPSIQFVVNIASNASASQQLSTKVSGGDTEGGSASVNTPTTVAQSADVITDSVHIGSFNEGDAEDFYYLYTRNIVGPNSTSGGPTLGPVYVTDVAPPGETIISMTGPGWTCSLLPAAMIQPPTIPFPDSETPADTCWRSDPLAVNTNYPNITVGVAVSDSAQTGIANVVTVSGGGNTAASTANGGQSFSDATTINPEPDLTVYSLQEVNGSTQPSVVFTQGDTAAAGDGFVITGYNYGYAPTSGPITITATLPPDFALVSTSPPATGSGWTCTAGTTKQIVTCTTSAAAAAGSALPSITVPVTVAPLAGTQPIVDVAISGGGEINPSNDLADDSTLVKQLPDLTISDIDSGNGKFHYNDTGDTFTLAVSDETVAATNGSTVTVTDTLPSGLTATAIAGSGWTCSAPTGNPGGTFTCTTSSVLNPSTAGGAFYPPITLTVNVDGSPSSPQVNTATVSGGGEVYTANDTATDSVVIAAPGSQAATDGDGSSSAQQAPQASDESASDGSSPSGSSDSSASAGSPSGGSSSGGSTSASGGGSSPAVAPAATVTPESMTAPPVASKPLSPRKLTALVKVLSRHRYTVAGTLSLPTGVTRAAGCKGSVTVTLERGRTVVLKQTAVVSSSCAYRVSATLSNAGGLAIIASFHGNSVLLPYVARV